uniref:Uncharacterized protein n=1 Tax=Meloidogyne enterolobii TaxID=390850 RepID=A0A6V7VAQ4_MELEN|nr:unnamed protein product [Meloidogyne enterolobii]
MAQSAVKLAMETGHEPFLGKGSHMGKLWRWWLSNYIRFDEDWESWLRIGVFINSNI